MRQLNPITVFLFSFPQYIVLSLVSCLLMLTANPVVSNANPDFPFGPGHFGPEESGLLFTIQGSNTVGARLAPAWAKDFLEAKGVQNPAIINRDKANEYRIVGTSQYDKSVYIDIAAHGSSTGFAGLLEGSADIAMSSRAIKPSEVNALKHLGDLRSFNGEHVIAIDGLAIIVNKNNTINSLTVDTIGKIFSGEIDNWRSINGKNKKITVYARDNNSGTWDTFKSLVLKKHYRLSPKAFRFESNDELSDRVAADDSGIGFVGLASVRQSKLLSVSEGESRPLKPRPLYVATEDYPLSRRLFMYAAEDQKNGHVKAFLDFVQSDIGQEKVAEIGFVSQVPLSVPAEMDQNTPEDYLAITQFAERLSINFRFGEGSAVLDNKAQRDVQRLTQYLQRPQNKDKRIQLIGFGDQKNTRSRELVLSKMRATMVKTALYKNGISTESVVGFGSWLPVADNDGASKLRNRRVEIWLYDEDVQEAIAAAKRQAEENAEKAIRDAYSISIR